MGEEKPSVPWVLEDYETSQVGMIPSEQKLKFLKQRKHGKQTDKQIVCFVKLPPTWQIISPNKKDQTDQVANCQVAKPTIMDYRDYR